MKKQCVVIGLGEFGKSLALTFEKEGCEVLAIDKKAVRIEAIADDVTHAVVADAADPEVIKKFGIGNFDIACITIGTNLEASILATILVKEAGVKHVLAKARSEMHAVVLRKVGADEIVFPEKSMGVRIAKNMVSGKFIDMIELSDEFSIVEINTPKNWIGKTLMQLNLRQLGLNLIAQKEHGIIKTVTNPERLFDGTEVYIVFGPNNVLKSLF